MSESTEWSIDNSRVYGNGQSYNCTNRVTAEQLLKTLTTYEQRIEHLHEIIEIEKQMKIVTMDLSVVKNDLEHIKERLEQIQ